MPCFIAKPHGLLSLMTYQGSHTNSTRIPSSMHSSEDSSQRCYHSFRLRSITRTKESSKKELSWILRAGVAAANMIFNLHVQQILNINQTYKETGLAIFLVHQQTSGLTLGLSHCLLFAIGHVENLLSHLNAMAFVPIYVENHCFLFSFFLK